MISDKKPGAVKKGALLSLRGIPPWRETEAISLIYMRLPRLDLPDSQRREEVK